MADRWMDERDREWRERDWRRAEGYGRSGGEGREPMRDPRRLGEGRSWAERGDEAGGPHGPRSGRRSPPGEPAADYGDARSYRADRDREERGAWRGGERRDLERFDDDERGYGGRWEPARRETWDERRAGADVRRMAGVHRGRGPKGYQRSDARISEEVHDRLTDDPWLDATDIEVTVRDGEVTLSGRVDSREAKHRAERLVEDLSGVRHVQVNLRTDPDAGFTGAGRGFGSSAVEAEMRRNEEATGLDPRTGRRRS